MKLNFLDILKQKILYKLIQWKTLKSILENILISWALEYYLSLKVIMLYFKKVKSNENILKSKTISTKTNQKIDSKQECKKKTYTKMSME